MLLRDNGGEDFAITPAGVHMAICYQVVDLGMKHNKTYNNWQRKLRVAWELPHERMEDGRPFSVQSTYTASLSTKANLRKDLESWRGRPFTEQELAGFDPKVLVGVPCQVNVVHNESGGNTYANVKAVMPLGKGMEVPPLTNQSLYFSWDSTPEAYDSLPDWMRDKAMGENPTTFVDPASEFNQKVDEANGFQGANPVGGPIHGDDFDDNIPF